MEFKEWLLEDERRFEDECKLIEEFGLEEGLLSTPLAFAAGAGGNFVSQTLRGLGNTVKGIAKTGVGAGQAALSLAQRAGGGRKAAGETFSKAKKNVAGGVGDMLRGATQVGASLIPVSPILRGAQAASEPFGISGVYAPAGKDRTWTQDLLGLDSWEGSGKKDDAEAAPAQDASEKDAKESARSSESKSSKSATGSELEGLVAAYRAVTSSSEPKFWVMRDGKVKGPYSPKAIFKGYKKGRVLDTDQFSDSPSGKWMGWISFRTVLSVSLGKKKPSDILATIATRYPKFYQSQLERSRERKSGRKA